MQYGYFDDAQREYVITRPDTPRPWSNYLGDSDFGGVITNNAAGYTFYKSADQGRLTRYRFNSIPADLCGRFVYLRDQESGDFWSNSWMPVVKPLESFQYQCRHGSGYTCIHSEYTNISSKVTYFSPLGELFEIWKVEVKNTGNRTRKVSVFPFIEPQCNWNATDDMKNLQYTQYIAKSSFVDGIIDIGSNVNMPEDPERFVNKDQKRHTFFAIAGAKPSAFDADLESFMGTSGNYSRPRAVAEGVCKNATAYGDMSCAAYQLNFELAPSETVSFACIFGVGSASTAGKKALARFDSVAKIDSALANVKQHWHSRFETLSVQTPDAGFNSMVNMWAPFNNLMTFYWSRTASLVYAGERDGLGYRDTVQDIVGVASLVTNEAHQRLELMLTGQYSNGGAKPVIQPFNHKPGQEAFPDHYRSDDSMWLFNAVPNFVKETGDIGFYSKVLPYADKGEGTVLDHLRRAIEFNIERSGAHHLPCGLHADWNDCIRLGEKGESVFVAMQLRYALNEYIKIATLVNNNAEAKWGTEQLAILDSNIEKHAWDGEWYLRAYRFDGLKFGSHENAEGKIFMNPQVWAVLSGLASGDRGKQIMTAMHQELATDYGLMLCSPPYVSTDPQVCLARLFNPGTKENGGIFNHTQGWAVMAAAKLGMGDRAWEYMRNVMPASFNERAEVRQVEPYVVCQSTHSRASDRYGSGRVSWLSGSAVWNYVAMTQAILGIQPEYEGLCVNPCLPSAWKGFTATRKFRGATYHITVENPQGKHCGVRSLVVDGKTVTGNIISPAPAGSTVHVIARIE